MPVIKSAVPRSLYLSLTAFISLLMKLITDSWLSSKVFRASFSSLRATSSERWVSFKKSLSVPSE